MSDVLICNCCGESLLLAVATSGVSRYMCMTMLYVQMSMISMVRVSMFS